MKNYVIKMAVIPLFEFPLMFGFFRYRIWIGCILLIFHFVSLCVNEFVNAAGVDWNGRDIK